MVLSTLISAVRWPLHDLAGNSMGSNNKYLMRMLKHMPLFHGVYFLFKLRILSRVGARRGEDLFLAQPYLMRPLLGQLCKTYQNEKRDAQALMSPHGRVWVQFRFNPSESVPNPFPTRPKSICKPFQIRSTSVDVAVLGPAMMHFLPSTLRS